MRQKASGGIRGSKDREADGQIKKKRREEVEDSARVEARRRILHELNLI